MAAVPELWSLGDFITMRISSYLLLLVSVLMFASAGYDEYRGITHIKASRSLPEIITKTSNPEQFHNAMTYHWAYASVVLIAGIIVCMIDRGLEKADPMAPDADGNIDVELRKDELDGKAMKKESSKPPEL
jgi:hypothetical protein